MKLASQYDRMHVAGAELAAVSVDDEVRQAGMSQRWGFTHTRFVSDPGGATYLQPLGLFDPDERGGIGLPGMVIVDPDGVEVPEGLRGYFRPAGFGAYFRGNMFGAVAIGRRVTDDASRELAREHRLMSQSMLDAWNSWEPNIA